MSERVYNDEGYDQNGIHKSIPDNLALKALEFANDKETQKKLSLITKDPEKQLELYLKHHRSHNKIEDKMSEEEFEEKRIELSKHLKRDIDYNEAQLLIQRHHQTYYEPEESDISKQKESTRKSLYGQSRENEKEAIRKYKEKHAQENTKLEMEEIRTKLEDLEEKYKNNIMR